MQFIIRDNGIEEVIIDIPDIDKQIVEHYVPCFKEWIKAGPVYFVQNKSEARRIALASETKQILKAQGIPIPEDDYNICRWRFSQPDYKSRKQLDDDRLTQLAAQAEITRIEAESAAQTAIDTETERLAAIEWEEQKQKEAAEQAAIVQAQMIKTAVDAAVAAALANQALKGS